VVIITLHHCFAHHSQTASTKTSHLVNMPTNTISGLSVGLAIFLYALAPVANAAAEQSSTTVQEMVSTSETAAPIPVSSDPSLVDDTLFKSQILSDHNVIVAPNPSWSSIADSKLQWYRAQHGAVNLTWNDKLADASQIWVSNCTTGFSVRSATP
jgi:uncharacterized protein YkwD